MCLSLMNLHGNRILHRNITLSNIFLTKDLRIKFGDVLFHSLLNEEETGLRNKLISPFYLSPELVKGERYTVKSDIWAVGCILYALANQEIPFKGDNLLSLGCNIVKSKLEDFEKKYSSKFANFVLSFLAKSPNERIRIKDAIDIIPKAVKIGYTEPPMPIPPKPFRTLITQQTHRNSRTPSIQRTIVSVSRKRAFTPLKEKGTRAASIGRNPRGFAQIVFMRESEVQYSYREKQRTISRFSNSYNLKTFDDSVFDRRGLSSSIDSNVRNWRSERNPYSKFGVIVHRPRTVARRTLRDLLK